MEKIISVVTGGASGMGLEVAKHLGAWGAVMIGGRTQSKIDKALEWLKSEGVEAYGHTCDVASLASVEAFAKAAAAIAPIRYVIHAGAISFNQGDVEAILNINVLGTVYINNVFLPYMENGVMVNFASTAGHMHQPSEEAIDIWNEPNAPDFVQKCAAILDEDDTYTAYGFSKRFVMFHTMANASRYAARGNRVLSISPGAFLTPMLEEQAQFTDMDQMAASTAVGRVGTPFEMARAVMSAIHPDLGYLTGCDILMDGGVFAIMTAEQL